MAAFFCQTGKRVTANRFAVTGYRRITAVHASISAWLSPCQLLINSTVLSIGRVV